MATPDASVREPRSQRIAAAGLLALVSATLFATAPLGLFANDESHYIITIAGLRSGTLTVPHTDGLTPTAALRHFLPASKKFPVTKTPVYPINPPLYALFGAAFAPMGLHGLTLLNTLALALAGWLVFLYTARLSDRRLMPWLAMLCFLFATHALEYGQQVWPQALSLALTIGGAYGCLKGRQQTLRWLLLGGICVGLAVGVRYQNIVYAAALALGLVLSKRRWRGVLLFAAGVAIPLVAISLINHTRIGSYNPISKGSSYLSQVRVLQPKKNTAPKKASTAAKQTAEPNRQHRVAATLDSLLMRVVSPSLASTNLGVRAHQDPDTGVVSIFGVPKKAWIQSAPWVLLVLILCIACVSRMPVQLARRQAPDGLDVELMTLGLIILAHVAGFAAAGPRWEGHTFNQRYFVEMTAPASIALALLFGQASFRAARLCVGLVIGAIAAGGALFARPGLSGLLIYTIPLVLAVLLVAYWFWVKHRRVQLGIGLTLGLCLGWSPALHIAQDLRASHKLRSIQYAWSQALEPKLPARAAVLGWNGTTFPHGERYLDRDIVMADLAIDGGHTSIKLLDDFLRQQRPILILERSFPPQLLAILKRHATKVGATIKHVQMTLRPDDQWVEQLRRALRPKEDPRQIYGLTVIEAAKQP